MHSSVYPINQLSGSAKFQAKTSWRLTNLFLPGENGDRYCVAYQAQNSNQVQQNSYKFMLLSKKYFGAQGSCLKVSFAKTLLFLFYLEFCVEMSCAKGLRGLKLLIPPPLPLKAFGGFKTPLTQVFLIVSNFRQTYQAAKTQRIGRNCSSLPPNPMSSGFHLSRPVDSGFLSHVIVHCVPTA